MRLLTRLYGIYIYSNNSIYHLHGSLPALTSLPQVNDSVNETYAVTMHISLNEQRVTTLGYAPCVVQPERMFQNEKRAHRTLPQNYVTLFVNGGPGGPRVQWRPRIYTAYFQLRCRQAVHSRVAKFRIAAVGNYLKHFTLQPQL